MADYALAVSAVVVQRYRGMAARAAEAEAHLWELAGIRPGAVVADVGCGPAAAAVEMARRVVPGGRVIGIERDQSALAAARAVLGASDDAPVVLRQGDATATGLEPGSVDVAVLRHVLAHNGGTEAAIVGHLAELVRPGGCVYLVDVDLTAIRTLHAPPEVDEITARYAEFHRRRGNDPVIGLRLADLLAAAGLEVLAFEGRYTIVTAQPGMRGPQWAARDSMVRDGLATQEDVARWGAAFEAMDAAPVRPVLFAPGFTAVGRRPD